ncbi:uncharacterized protein LOC127750331 [Frankliniella occidentalis]|uniref:Uncharacterized protein LOC127750331 n=1 Tax=Frankliniella occidentalis TaxID=133901 RepID=A0A9C6X267_FRAOC|nr:uncharacterized protein LOC127750331 [Frankliniella occidentalis]
MADRNVNRNNNRTSPYKKVLERNASYFGYISTSSLQPNKAYKIVKLIHTNHVSYGEGELAFVLGGKGERWKTQLPSKYLSTFMPEDIEIVRSDVLGNKNPYLVFRQVLADKSFKIDFIEKDSDLIPNINTLHDQWKDVPALPEPGK